MQYLGNLINHILFTIEHRKFRIRAMDHGSRPWGHLANSFQMFKLNFKNMFYNCGRDSDTYKLTNANSA